MGDKNSKTGKFEPAGRNVYKKKEKKSAPSKNKMDGSEPAKTVKTKLKRGKSGKFEKK